MTDKELEDFNNKYNSHIPEDFRKSMREFDEIMANPQWERFMGNNHERIKLDMQSGEAVHFAHHLGRPLSVSLWRELVGAMKLENFRIYKPNDTQWLDGRYNSADIYLDENDYVSDIVIFPEMYRGEANPKEIIYYEEIGEAVINDYALAHIDLEK